MLIIRTAQCSVDVFYAICKFLLQAARQATHVCALQLSSPNAFTDDLCGARLSHPAIERVSSSDGDAVMGVQEAL